MPASMRAAVPVFAALGDATRLALVQQLVAEGPASLSRLSAGSRVTRQAITKHLRVLADAGLVYSERQGRTTVWAYRHGRVDQARRALDAISAQWDAALGRLKDFVER